MGEGDNDSKCEERYQTIDNQNKRSLMSDLLFLLLAFSLRLLEIGYWRLAIGDWLLAIGKALLLLLLVVALLDAVLQFGIHDELDLGAAEGMTLLFGSSDEVIELLCLINFAI